MIDAGLITHHKGTPDDADALFDMLVDMHAEGGFLPLDHGKARARVVEVITSGFVVLACDGSKIVGSVGIAPSPHWYSRSDVWADFWTYVRPGHRKSSIAADLLATVKEWVTREGITVFMAVTSPHETDRKEKLFARHLRPVGRIFVEDGGHVLRW